MPAKIRQATPADVAQWLELLKGVAGEDYPDKLVYDSAWAQAQLGGDVETWIAEENGRILSSISLLPPREGSANPVLNLGRHFVRPESVADGSAELLLRRINEMADACRRWAVARVRTTDNEQQILYEKQAYTCVGYQPSKHMLRVREGVLFYLRIPTGQLMPRDPVSDSLAQVAELATEVLSRMNIPPLTFMRDGAVGYPLQSELDYEETDLSGYESACSDVASQNPPEEISGAFSFGCGYLRAGEGSVRAVLGRQGGHLVAGMLYCFDEMDRCVRVVGGFCTDNLSMGSILRDVVKTAQERHSAIYVEIDVLATAPRLLKAAEQLGFMPVAYLPGFCSAADRYADVVKLVKLNMSYSAESASMTSGARSVVTIVEQNFQDQKLGVAIINLLRGLPIFEGLGDGELRKIARLFTQKLYRPGERIFSKGDSGDEAYVVMRGQIDIVLEEGGKPIATLGNGQIFGELAFLDGAARVALAEASQPSILLVIQRSEFNTLTHREPHLGMVVMRNIAMELSNRLRRTNTAVSGKK